MSATLEFARVPAERVPAARRTELLGLPGFGDVFTDHLVTARWHAERGWHDATVGPLAPFALHPATMAFHYGQTVFEGLKAFWRPDGRRALFRPADHARRFARSARRMAMPPLPEDDFRAALAELLRADGAWVPAVRGHSFYLRPFMIATEAHLSNRPAEEYLFALLGSPARPPLAAEPKPVRLWASTEHVRAAPGGTGAIKCGGNYGGSYLAQREAVAHGCDQVVWLDPVERRHLEEVGGSNLVLVGTTAGGQPVLRTPPLSDTLLAGITRDSILRLAGRLGYAVVEEPILIEDWERGCRDGEVTEAFICGTARAVVPVGHVVWGARDWPVGDGRSGPVTARLRAALLDIQYGAAPDEFGWIELVDGGGEAW